ncbi:MAG: NAD-dependent epimerase/dehydratase family protein [Candidatus Yanofskybacteria bacterium]|nr:NAD-dependent epimerase/dehydratase family protein [Candidatus Yanofskybacteria bacterium]
MMHVIGSNGFVGSAICAHFEKMALEHVGINRGNYEKNIGSRAHYLINASGSGSKGKANENPRVDFQRNVQHTINLVFDFKYDVFVHISSVDVYPEPSFLEKTDEDFPIDPTKLSPYGFHKYLSELIVRRYCPNWIILRLGGLVGPNLKKNPIYDWTHGKPFFISRKSRLTFIHTQTVAEIIECIIERRITREIINICSSDSIILQDLTSIANFKIEEMPVQDKLEIQDYKINADKLKEFFKVQTSRFYIKKYLEENL